MPGGDFKLEDKEKLIVGLLKKYKFLNRHWAERLFKTFGTDVEKVLGKAKAKQDLGRNFGSDLTEREVLWYINQEHAFAPFFSASKIFSSTNRESSTQQSVYASPLV